MNHPAIRDIYVDKLHVRVFRTREEMGACVGAEAAAAINALMERQETVNVMFGAAPSQNEMLVALRTSDVDWRRVHAFHMDEYIGLAPDHPAGFGNFLERSIFRYLPFAGVHLLNGGAADPLEECRRYSQLLEEHPLDLCMLGVGENGHLAFNDPPTADFHDPYPVKVVELEERCRAQQVHDGCFETLEQVPTHALTVTIPVLCSAKHLFCTVPAASKAQAVFSMLKGPVSTDCPASIVRQQERAELYLDIDSADLICHEEGGKVTAVSGPSPAKALQ